ncbi:uncharacterized protein [Aristolochia californica]|uniref:uncharacterized protein isoform X1 n=1 Tax=Aristolochia californica TaxID=171875 RepID=UPI0035DFDF6E
MVFNLTTVEFSGKFSWRSNLLFSMDNEKRIVSGVQPTGSVQLGIILVPLKIGCLHKMRLWFPTRKSHPMHRICIKFFWKALKKAASIADATLDNVYQAMGFFRRGLAHVGFSKWDVSVLRKDRQSYLLEA